MSNLARTQRRDSHEIMAEIFNNLDRVSEGRIMSSLEERNRDSAERIRSLMFTFEDLRRLDGQAIGILLRAFDTQKLLLALKGASPELRELFLGNMTGRASKLMRDDLAAMGPVRLKDVDEAQGALVLAAKELAAQGQITLAEGRNEEMIE
jgi:flagellar motor switch protein FliG